MKNKIRTVERKPCFQLKCIRCKKRKGYLLDAKVLQGDFICSRCYHTFDSRFDKHNGEKPILAKNT